VKHFTWHVIISKVATRDKLHIIWVELGSRICVICQVNDEIFTHMFFNCRIVAHIWKMCDFWKRVSSAYHNNPDIDLCQFGHLRLNTN